MSAGVKIKWNDALIREKIRKGIDKGSEMVAQEVLTKAKNTTDFKDNTGNLRQSIKMFKSKFEKGGYVVMADAPHAHLIEFGHGGRSPAGPKPFMRNALASSKAKGKQTIMSEVKKALK